MSPANDGPDPEPDPETGGLPPAPDGDEHALLEYVACWLPVVSGRVQALQEALQENRWVPTRMFVVCASLFAVVIAALASGFAVWNINQDNVRARNHEVNQARDNANLEKIAELAHQNAANVAKIERLQRVNVAFREGVCAEAADWKVYLRDAPAGTAEGRRSANQISANLDSLCAAGSGS